MHYKKIILFTAIASLVASFLLGYVLFFSKEKKFLANEPIEAPKKQVEIYYIPVANYFSDLKKVTSGDIKKEQFIVAKKDLENLTSLGVSQEEAIVVDSYQDLVSEVNKSKKIALIPWYEVSSNLKTLSFDDTYFWEADSLDNYGLKTLIEVEENSDFLEFDNKNLVKINFLGDVILSRYVGVQMSRYGYDYPWLKVREETAKADITFANLEAPLSDLYASPPAGMNFISSTKNSKHLKAAGIDIVSVANNHSANFGYNVFKDSLNNLKNSEIGVCGGGLNEAEARKVKIIEVSGLKFGFLCHSSIIGSLYAKNNSAGVPYLGIEPWYRNDTESINKMINDIQAAKKEVDVVIFSPHWGVEYKHYPSDSQKIIAKKAIEAGADIVIGTHPHVVQGSEFYKNKYITYSLGNFIFDQEWSTETKQGTMLSAYFYKDKNVASVLRPIEISNYAQPRFVSGSIYSKIIATIRKNSVNLY